MTRSRPMVEAVPRLLHEIGQQGEETGALDRLGELALLLRRHRRDPARHDLAALGDEALQQLHVLVVDLGRGRPGEGAGFAAPEERAPTATAATVATVAAIAAAGTTRT